MEFGIFLNGYMPGPLAHDTEAEHVRLMREAEYAIFADKHNWKYAWFGEHHGLVEYSPHVGPRGRHGLCSRPRPTTSTSRPASTACRRARSTRCGTPSAPR